MPVPDWLRRNAGVLVFASIESLLVGEVVERPRLPDEVTMSAVEVAADVEVEMRNRGLVEFELPAIASLAVGLVVPRPTLPELDSTTNLSVWTAMPPAKVEVAVVEVAVKWVAVEVP